MSARLTEAQLWDKLDAQGLAKGPRPKERRKMSREESQMQIAFVQWWKVNCRLFNVPELCLFSIPNGGGRSGPIVGSILKAEGLRKGAPDLFLGAPMFRSRTWSWDHGLFLELKRKDGALSPEQEAYHKILRLQDYKVNVCWSLAECIDVTTTYLTK